MRSTSFPQRRLLHLPLLYLLSGCGAVGNPQPPSLGIPKPVQDLSLQRAGDTVTLSWTRPSQTTDLLKFRKPVTIRVCRALGNAPPKQCAPITEIHLPALTGANAGAPEQLGWKDILKPDIQDPHGSASYAVEALNERGASAGLSNIVRVALTPAPPIPENLHLELLPEGVRLSWNTPAEAIAYPTGFVVNRQSHESPKDSVSISLSNRSSQAAYIDQKIDWEKHYIYSMHSTMAADGFTTVSQETPAAEIFTHDTFPPAAPSGLQAVFSETSGRQFIDLTWNANTERDLAGYNVFRGRSPGNRSKLNTQILQIPSFRDPSVLPGEAYYYSVTAVDLRGNESEPSPFATETVPR